MKSQWVWLLVAWMMTWWKNQSFRQQLMLMYVHGYISMYISQDTQEILARIWLTDH